MTLIITVVHILVSLALVFIVLLQKGSGADMGAAFGGSSQSVFGARGSGSFLGKVTAALATVFMITSLSLAFVSTQRGSHASVMEKNQPISKPVSEASEPASPMPAKESSKSSESNAQPASVPTPPSEK
ncbi:MAG: preprotein translocase subunit SecG [Magnetococcales bacterium]|nr:preprotein translocase subunit SecG [Magnetococcales bacterium]MBF0116372.1 preprotein translocase subunit SecG [Magnetococcales bacterium]